MNPRCLNLIAARARNGVIGRGNGIPWAYPADMEHFRAVTWNHAVIMGRLTWWSIGRRPLRNRKCIVLSRGMTVPDEGSYVAKDVEQAIAMAWDLTGAVPFVIGGAAVYQAAMPLVTRIIMTEIDEDHPGDTRFPEIPGDFEETQRHTQGPLTFRTLERAVRAT